MIRILLGKEFRTLLTMFRRCGTSRGRIAAVSTVGFDCISHMRVASHMFALLWLVVCCMM
jgi:hypothetical protein